MLFRPLAVKGEVLLHRAGSLVQTLNAT